MSDSAAFIRAVFFRDNNSSISKEERLAGKSQAGRQSHQLAMVIENPPHRTSWSRSWRANLLTRKAQFVLDTFVLISAFVLAYLLRFDFHLPEQDARHMLYQLPFVLLFQLVLLWLAGIYAFVWRYVGMAEVKAFIVAALWSALPLLALRTSLPEQLQAGRIPISITVVDTLIAFGGVLALRVLRRALYERGTKRQKVKGQLQKRLVKKPVLLIGAGRAGVMIAREIRLRGDIDLEVRGFIDDDSSKMGSVIQGVKVLGTAEDIPRLVTELDIDHVVISFAEASRRDFRRILDICERVRVRVRTVQLVKQVARFKPACLLLVERAEFALFAIEHEMRSDDESQVPVIPLVADIGDKTRMHTIFQTYSPQVILHAAAHKHVPMMESNPCEAVKNNVVGTRLLGEMASDFGVEAFVLISTDKAVRPSSVMGASKRIAELVIQDFNQRSHTRFLAVRFGNVIGSAGSVIPIFRDQIRSGGPVTVTHPEMVRYFMTIPEAAQLVLQAGALGKGGEIFVLDMGDPVRILDLAKETITLSGLRPFEDINIVFTGVRPGEKLYEELQTSDERVEKTRHPKIFIGRIAAYPEEKVRHALERLSLLAENGWDRELRRAINDLLPEAQLSIPKEDFVPIVESYQARSTIAVGD